MSVKMAAAIAAMAALLKGCRRLVRGESMSLAGPRQLGPATLANRSVALPCYESVFGLTKQQAEELLDRLENCGVQDRSISYKAGEGFAVHFSPVYPSPG